METRAIGSQTRNRPLFAKLLFLFILLGAGSVSACGSTPDAGDVKDDDTLASPDVFEPIEFTVMTFNTGTSEGMGSQGPDDGYTEWHAQQSDTYYGDGLAWTPAVEAATNFIAEFMPDIIVFQEIFYTEECETIPETSWTDFICEDWQTGDPTVSRVITGEGYQVMCNWGKPDKCAAVRKEFGHFAGCDSDFCLDGMEGYKVDTCGSGSRIGRATIELNTGGTITLVNVHGSSGFKEDEMQCRVWQFQQVFEDFGDGTGLPAASGDRNLIMGDFNTDPGRAVIFDPSAVKLVEHVGTDKPFHFITEVGENVVPTYGGVGNIDHVISDVFTGSCWAAGVSEGHPAVIDAYYFDHVPVVCTLNDIDQAGD